MQVQKESRNVKQLGNRGNYGEKVLTVLQDVPIISPRFLQSFTIGNQVPVEVLYFNESKAASNLKEMQISHDMLFHDESLRKWEDSGRHLDLHIFETEKSCLTKLGLGLPVESSRQICLEAAVTSTARLPQSQVKRII